MIGICGGVVQDNASLAQALCESLQHRGPMKLHIGHAFFLGGEHLAQIGQITAVFSGRLINDKAINHALDLPRRTDPATTVAAAFQRWPNDIQHRLQGDYTIAVWHNKYQSMTLIRDRIGNAPLYFCEDRNQFVFACEQTAIAAVRPSSLNPGRIADVLLSYEWVTAEESWFSDIKRLPPASYLQVKRGRVESHRYWTPTVDDQVTASDADTNLHHFRSLLGDVISDHGKTSTALCFSGGLDSLTIAEAALQKGHSAVLLSGLSAEANGDSVAIDSYRSLRPQATITTIDTREMDSSGLHHLHEHLDDPFPASHTISLALFTRARELGINHIWDGVDGDLTYSLGNEYLHVLLANRQLKDFWQQVTEREQSMGNNRQREALRTLAGTFMPDAVRQWRFNHQLLPSINSHLSSVMQPQHVSFATDRYRQLLRPNTRHRRSFDQFHRQQLEKPYIDVALERYDKVAAVTGVNISHPLLDYRMVEFGLSLPWQQKRLGGDTKVLMRQLHRGTDTETLAARTDKPHFGAAFTAEIGRREQARIDDFFADNNHRWQAWLKEDAILRQISEAKRSGNNGVVWLIYQLAVWLDKWG